MNIQHEVTGSNAVFSEECKGSVSWEGEEDVDNVYVG